MPRDSIDILSLTSKEAVAQVAALSVPSTSAIDMYRSVYRHGQRDTDSLRFPNLHVTKATREKNAMKFALSDRDERETESVILFKQGSSGRDRNTLCVSSQIGCAMSCDFCETAQMGLVRQLDASEIVMQWFVARHEFGYTIDNVVFMGMGEPMDNPDAVLQAIRVLTDHDGASVAASNITVSTVGHVPGIQRLITFANEPGFRQIRLAVSINAPTDDIRSQLMPINRAYSMAQLMDAMRAWNSAVRNRRVLIEYVLIPGVNDDDTCPRELAAYLNGLACTVNVIPYNPRRESPWPAPDEDAVSLFISRLHDRGVRVRRRQTLGCSLMAACGQLGNTAVRKRRFVLPAIRA